MRLLKDTAFTAVISPQARRGTGMGTTGQAGTAQGIPPILCCQAGLHPSRTSGIHLSCEMLRMILSSSRPFSLGPAPCQAPKGPRPAGWPSRGGWALVHGLHRKELGSARLPGPATTTPLCLLPWSPPSPEVLRSSWERASGPGV